MALAIAVRQTEKSYQQPLVWACGWLLRRVRLNQVIDQWCYVVRCRFQIACCRLTYKEGIDVPASVGLLGFQQYNRHRGIARCRKPQSPIALACIRSELIQCWEQTGCTSIKYVWNFIQDIKRVLANLGPHNFMKFVERRLREPDLHSTKKMPAAYFSKVLVH